MGIARLTPALASDFIIVEDGTSPSWGSSAAMLTVGLLLLLVFLWMAISQGQSHEREPDV